MRIESSKDYVTNSYQVLIIRAQFSFDSIRLWLSGLREMGVPVVP